MRPTTTAHSATDASTQAVRVWDLPTRVFHWLLVLLVLGLVVTSQVGGNAMEWHMRMGIAVLVLVLFRWAWGLVGGHWSRFSSMVAGPGTVLRYLKQPHEFETRIGHNPLGFWSVIAMLVVLLAQAGSGLFSDDEIAFAGPLTSWVSGSWVSLLTTYHKAIGKFLLIALVILHLLAIGYHTIAKKHPLIGPMIRGDKRLPKHHTFTPSRDGWPQRLLAVALFLVCALAVVSLVRAGGFA